MKQETIDGMVFAATLKDVTALAESIMRAEDASIGGRATYLRSLLAGVQVELIGKPVLRALRGDRKAPSVEAALAAVEKVNAQYYEAVLAVVPDGLTAEERNARTNFARSAASTLRRAVKLGWPVLTPINDASKVVLSRWVKEHSASRPVTLQRAQTQVGGMIERIQQILAKLPDAEARAVARAAVEELSGVTPQRLTSVSLRRHENRSGASAH